MAQKLRILQIANVRWYNACAYYAVTLSSGLQKRGHQVIFLGDPQSPPVKKARKFGLRTIDGFFLSTTNPVQMIYAIKKIAEIVEQEKIDVINVHRGEGHFLSAVAKRMAKKKFLLIRTRGDVRVPQPHILNKILYNRWTDGVIATCEVIKSSYRKNLNLNKTMFSSILTGIDEKYFSTDFSNKSSRESYGIQNNELVVGMVGRLSPIKGHRYYIQAADFVLKKIPQVKFVIAGEDAQIQMTELERMTQELKIKESFIFLGKVKDIREVISLFDIGVVASIGSETICRVALEYMALAKPVVGTDINAIPEVVRDKFNGIIVPAKDSKKMGEAILELLQDRAAREKMGKTGRVLSETEFSLDSFAQKTEEVYFQLLEKCNYKN